jgi:septal ring factor EnvC (AmiA/AmiB activator)
MGRLSFPAAIPALLLVLCLSQSASAVDEGAGTLTRDDIDREMREAEQELERVRNDLEEKRRKARDLEGRERDLTAEIARLDEEIAANRELLSRLADKKEILMKDLEITQADLALAEASYQEARDLLGKRLKAIYKFGRGEVMEVVLLSKTFADLAKRIYYLSIVADHDRQLMSMFEERVETRRVLMDHIETKRVRMESLEDEVAGETRNLQLKKEERDALIGELKERRYYYENLARQLEETGRNLEVLLGDLEARRDRAPAATSFEERKGNLMWPCEGQVISSFGVHTHPRFGTLIRNNGVDIRTTPGTKVRAVAPGVVSFSGTLSAFGNCILIDHGEGYYTLYGHLESLLVEVDYPVREGDALGFIGEMSTPDGAVLHFELRKGRDPLDPEEWLLN